MKKMFTLPLVIVSKRGVDLVQDESTLPPLARLRLGERRRHRALWWTANGIVCGICLAFVVPLAAQGNASLASEWASPSSVMAMVTLVFAGGQMWNARLEDRRRIQKLEDNSVTKEELNGLSGTVVRIESKLDRIVERIHEAQFK